MKTTAQHFLKFRNLLTISFAGLILAGCASISPVETRKREDPAAYRVLSPEVRAAVDQGKLKEGMDTNAVYIAWGKPTEVLKGGDGSQETTTWVYRAGYIQKQDFVGTYQERGAYSPQTYVHAQVTFVNGAVQKWQMYPPPVH